MTHKQIVKQWLQDRYTEQCELFPIGMASISWEGYYRVNRVYMERSTYWKLALAENPKYK